MNPQRGRIFAVFWSSGKTEVRCGLDLVALATWTTVRQPDLAVFLWHFGARLPSVALERMTIDHLMLALVGAISCNISWNICRGMATSAIWKAT